MKLCSAAAGVAALLMAAAPAAAQAPAASPAGTTAAKAASPAAGVDPGDRIVCRSVRYTGSRFPERECRTKRAWDEKGQAARAAFDERIDSNRRNNVGSAAPYNTHSGAPR